MALGQLLWDTALITSSRAALFLSCRKLLLGSLYQELTHLSSNPEDGKIIELDSLPAPTSAPSASGRANASKRSLHSTVARTLFCICFSESCTLFLMLMCQGVNVFGPQTRLLNWRISLFLLLSIILVVIPLSLSVVFPSAFTSSNANASRSPIPSLPRLLLIVTPLGIYFFLLSFIPIPAALSTPTTSSLLTSALSRLTVLGILILGSLSGFGAVTTAWGYFPFVCNKSRKQTTHADVELAEQSLQRVRRDLGGKREEIETLKGRGGDTENAKPSGSWLSRVTTSFQGDSELSNLKTELSVLVSLEEHMSSQLTWMRQQHSEAEYDRTWSGKVLVLGRRAMGFYCIFRGLSSLVNILLPATKPSADRSYPDLLTSLIIMLLSLFSSDPTFPSPELKSDLSSILRQVNLALVGIIIWSSVRRVLRGVARALRMTSRNKTASFMLLILAQLMGTYLLSTLIQLRTSFPPPLASDDSPADSEEVVNLFTTLPEYQFFGPVFDWSFLLAAGGAALIEWARDKMTDGSDVH